jgi:hypothetical protein
VVEEHILKRASSEQHNDEEGPSKAPMPTGLHKLSGMVRDTWRFCNWIATQLFELREDMKRLLKHQGLSFNTMLPPPPIFPDFQSIPLVRMKVRRTLSVLWVEMMCLLLNLKKKKKKKKTLSH